MSKAHVETDADKAARKAATITVGKDAHGNPSFALEVIDPKGALVQVPTDTKIKPGWRFATDKDRKAKQAELEKQHPIAK